MSSTFVFYADPSHAWLEVPFCELNRLSLNPSDFSRYSYRRNNTFYLEEDCDAPKFLAAYEAKNGKPEFVEQHSNGPSFIRSLPSIY